MYLHRYLEARSSLQCTALYS